MKEAPRTLVEAGSFRDRQGRVFRHRGGVYRGLTPRALEEWEALSATRFFRRFSAAGRIVGTRLADLAPAELAAASPDWAAALAHEPIPFVSHPYEWSFGMLREAALLQLDLLLAALEEGMVLKDASAYNVQWRGASPVFIDVGSFERLRPGEPWVGYLQFCQLFLYPLMLRAYKGVPFQPWLRGSLDGIPPEVCARLMSWRDLLRPGVLAHAVLQAKLQRRAAAARTSLKKEIGASGFEARMIAANARRLRKLVAGLAWEPGESAWSRYAEEHSYGTEDEAAKRAFVEEAVGERPWELAWDLGANVGTYSRIAARRAGYVVAMDADEPTVERLYRQLRQEGPGNILPLVVDLTDPSPDLGWRGAERRALTGRGSPDLVLCLALIHHVVIGRNVLLPDLIDWLADLGGHLVIEFVAKEDPMVRRLLLNKEDVYTDYGPEAFRAAFGRRFELLAKKDLASGTRTLYFGRPKGT